MSIAGTALAVIFSLPLGLLAAPNTSPHPIVYLTVRTFLAFLRSVPEIILGVLFVAAVGFGALAGILALTVASVGFVGKLFTEAIEEISLKQVEAVRATGAPFMSVVVFGVLPQVFARFIGFASYELDANLRNSTMVGIVGAGGIGGTLFAAFQRFDYDFVCAILISIIVMIMIGEVLAGWVRGVFLERRVGQPDVLDRRDPRDLRARPLASEKVAMNGDSHAGSGKLGVAVRPLSPDEKAAASLDHGVVVEDVGGAAADAGVQPGDVILAVNRSPVTSPAQLKALIGKAGKTVALLVQRDEARIFTATERLRGYRDALSRHGIVFDEALVRMELHSSAAASEAAGELLGLDEPPTALFSAQNLITIGVVERLRMLGVHHSVALVGFDDLTLADAVEPGLTVVAQDAGELGRLTAERLFARLDGDGGPTRQVVVPTRLIERGSGELVP